MARPKKIHGIDLDFKGTSTEARFEACFELLRQGKISPRDFDTLSKVVQRGLEIRDHAELRQKILAWEASRNAQIEQLRLQAPAGRRTVEVEGEDVQ